jgi:DNA gyrase/topoisomerase IV subunit A
MDDNLMAKQASKTTTQTQATVVPQIVSTVSSDFIKTSSREYAIYTAQNRAIPSICDGLKDGQRKAIWGIRNLKEKIKVISLSGSIIAEGWFLHGDVSASDTISRLAAPYLNNVTLLEGVGAFGTRVTPDGWGAPRYTYVKKNKATQALLYPDLDIVPLKPNYDGSVMEPCNFLPLIPLVLLNGISGIAVGWSTDILPHSLQDIVSATIAAIDNKPIPKILPKFDCMNVQTKDLGDNSYEFSGRATVESATTVRVTELPPDLSLERFKARLNTMEDEGLINTYTDRSTKTIDVEIRFKRGSIDNWQEQDAINFLKLKSKASERFVVLDFNNSSIRQYENTEDLVKSFVEWRLGWFTVRFQKQIADLTKELNFACGVKACVDKGLPKFLPIAPNKSSVEDQVRKICTKIKLDDSQIERLVSFPSYRWAQDSVSKIEQEIVDLGNQIVALEDILNDPKQIKSIYKQEVQALLKLC